MITVYLSAETALVFKLEYHNLTEQSLNQRVKVTTTIEQ